MKLLILLTVLFFVLTGCTTKQPCEPIVVYNTKDVYIPVPCKIEHPECNISGATNKEVLDSMIKCIADQYMVIEACKAK